MFPRERFVRCNKCGREYPRCSVANCKHPAVNRVFGKNICMYCCRKCKHHIQLTVKEHGLNGVQCGYDEERSE